MEQLTDAQIRHIFVEVSCGRGNHGSFLQSFSMAVSFADPSNFHLIRDSALELIRKYELKSYLNNFKG